MNQDRIYVASTMRYMRELKCLRNQLNIVLDCDNEMAACWLPHATKQIK